MVDLSVIVPAFNEGKRIEETLQQLQAWAAKRGDAIEIIVVDDGSTDETAAIAGARVVAETERGATIVSVIRSRPNRGKGHALRVGTARARGTWVLLCDADLSTPIEEFERLAGAAREDGAAIVIASRDLPGSRLEPAQAWHRRLLAGLFRTLRRALILRNIRDTQCGFKLLRGDVARELFAQTKLDGWLIDCELLRLAELRGERIVEVPVRWRNDPRSHVRPLLHLPRTLRELWQVWRMR